MHRAMHFCTIRNTVLFVTLPTYLSNNYQINIKYIQHNNIFSNNYPQHKNYVLNTAIFEILWSLSIGFISKLNVTKIKNQYHALVKQIYQAFIKDFYIRCIIIYKVRNVTDWLEKGGSRSETLIYASPLYIVGNKQLADNDWWNKQHTMQVKTKLS